MVRARARRLYRSRTQHPRQPEAATVRFLGNLAELFRDFLHSGLRNDINALRAEFENGRFANVEGPETNNLRADISGLQNDTVEKMDGVNDANERVRQATDQNVGGCNNDVGGSSRPSVLSEEEIQNLRNHIHGNAGFQHIVPTVRFNDMHGSLGRIHEADQNARDAVQSIKSKNILQSRRVGMVWNVAFLV